MYEFSNIIKVDLVIRSGENLDEYLLGRSRRRLTPTNELEEGGSVYVSIDLWGALKILRQVSLSDDFPFSLESISITTTLYAATKAQRELSDAGSYDPERARQILRSQGYSTDFYVCRKRPVYVDGKWQEPYVVDGKVSDSMEVNSTRGNFQTVFEVFERINQDNRDIWGFPREKLLYIPEEMFLYFGGLDLKTASVYLFASDDRCLDELPHIRVNRIAPEALSFLLGNRFEERDGRYAVHCNYRE